MQKAEGFRKQRRVRPKHQPHHTPPTAFKEFNDSDLVHKAKGLEGTFDLLLMARARVSQGAPLTNQDYSAGTGRRRLVLVPIAARACVSALLRIAGGTENRQQKDEESRTFTRKRRQEEIGLVKPQVTFTRFIYTIRSTGRIVTEGCVTL